jgi:MYXO-CTERM domain-containing protein
VNPPNEVKPGFDPTSVFGKYAWNAKQPDTMFPALSQPAVGDLDQDGVPDPVMSGASLSVLGSIESGSGTPQYGQYLIAAWSGATGKMLDGMPTQVEDMQFLTMPSIADISGDDYPEVILGSGVYFIHAVDACGNEPQGWPKFTNGWTTSAAAVGDIVGDGALDVISTTREGYLFAWKTKGSPTGVVQWESFHHDNQNSGSYAHKLDQGKLGKAPPPDCAPPPPPPMYDVSGCTCDVTGKSASQSGLILAVIGLALAISRRRQPRA